MEVSLPALIAFGSLGVAVVGAILTDQRSKARAEVVGQDAKTAAARASGSLAELTIDLSRLREATAAMARDVDRLRESKADVVVVSGLDKAVQDLRVEVLRQLEKIDRHLERLEEPRSRRSPRR